MLEYLKTGKHLVSVWREAMGNRSALVGLIQKSGLDETTRMFRDSLQIAAEATAHIIECDPLGSTDEEQDTDPTMISYALEVPLELLIRLDSGHIRDANISPLP